MNLELDMVDLDSRLIRLCILTLILCICIFADIQGLQKLAFNVLLCFTLVIGDGIIIRACLGYIGLEICIAAL